MEGFGLRTAIAVLLVTYVLLVRALRWHRYNDIHRKFGRKYQQGKLTVQDAQEILLVGALYDLPGLSAFAGTVAFFKTFSIPTISKLLCATKQLKSSETVSKRLADTDILFTTVKSCPISGQWSPDDPDDPRAMIALARINWLHSKYKISNGDYLYTLTLAITEPIEWCRRYGWRELSPMEQHALFLYWSEIGRRMNIKHIPDSVEGFKAWSKAYEEEHMVPTQTNHDLARTTLNEMVYSFPEAVGIKNFIRGMIICLFDPLVRTAVIQPEQPWYTRTFVRMLLGGFKYYHRYLSLPRWRPQTTINLDMPHHNTSGRMHPTMWQVKPWYKPKRRGLGVILDRMAVMFGVHDDMPGPKYRSDGYRIEELGPLYFEKDGHEEVLCNAEELRGCPIQSMWALWAMDFKPMEPIEE